MEYAELVIEHLMNPRNMGRIEDPDGVGKVSDPVRGDLMEMMIRVREGRIADIKFRTFGGGAAIATSSIATEMVMGKTLEEAVKLNHQQVAEALGGLPPQNIHCSNLATEALHGALEDYYSKHPEARPAKRSGRWPSSEPRCSWIGKLSDSQGTSQLKSV